MEYKKTSSVAASSTETENMALLEPVREALWLKSSTASITFNLEEPVLKYEDNNDITEKIEIYRYKI